MTLKYFMKRLRELYDVDAIYYAYRDEVELHFHDKKLCLTYLGKELTACTFNDMVSKIEHDMNYILKGE